MNRMNNQELLEALNRYENAFGDSFPTIPLMRGRTEKEVIAIMERCIEEKKDVYDLGYINLDDNY